MQAETAAIHSLCLLLTIQLPLEHFGPGKMPSDIMTLKGNSSQPTLVISDLGVSKVVVSSPSNGASLVGDYSVTSCEHMMNLRRLLSLTVCLSQLTQTGHTLSWWLRSGERRATMGIAKPNPSVGLAALD